MTANKNTEYKLIEKMLICIALVGIVGASVLLESDRLKGLFPFKLGSYSGQEIGRLEKSSHEIRTRHQNDLEWIHLSEAAPVFNGDLIFTGKNSHGHFKLRNGSDIQTKPETLIVLHQYDGKDFIHLKKGLIFGSLVKNKDVIISVNGQYKKISSQWKNSEFEITSSSNSKEPPRLRVSDASVQVAAFVPTPDMLKAIHLRANQANQVVNAKGIHSAIKNSDLQTFPAAPSELSSREETERLERMEEFPDAMITQDIIAPELQVEVSPQLKEEGSPNRDPDKSQSRLADLKLPIISQLPAEGMEGAPRVAGSRAPASDFEDKISSPIKNYPAPSAVRLKSLESKEEGVLPFGSQDAPVSREMPTQQEEEVEADPSTELSRSHDFKIAQLPDASLMRERARGVTQTKREEARVEHKDQKKADAADTSGVEITEAELPLASLNDQASSSLIASPDTSSGYNQLSLSPHFSYSNISGTQSNNLSQGNLASNLNLGLDVGYRFVWNDSIQSAVGGGFTEMSFEDPLNRSIENPNQILTFLEVDTKWNIASPLTLGIYGGFGQVPFYESTDVFTFKLFKANVPYIGISAHYDLFQYHSFQFGIEGKASYLLSTTSGGLDVLAGSSYKTAFSITKKVDAAEIKVSLFYQKVNQSTSFLNESIDELGVHFDINFDLWKK